MAVLGSLLTVRPHGAAVRPHCPFGRTVWPFGRTVLPNGRTVRQIIADERTLLPPYPSFVLS